ncbi:hypothetical protein DFJ58DRAFT_339220 [Suillus subalutaceus]|uniref:uncharacterized protein n=1 Tax=Suillus subalutaceus TaxID=48586 RepID=UPI001B86638B|nr:uncharacterized protein DFJ58DRAFT_339220 [Suillus subalutaceus]KAG1828055.1 hypothetical protein DFJ58DRAFT_339220 [Suillus subalutaceus]
MTNKYASRKFIDLIQRATSKWANWDPPRKIAVGDYGTIINETGEFDWEGNIYSADFQEQLKLSKYKFNIDFADSALLPNEHEGGDDHFIVKSWSATTKEVNTSTDVAAPGVVNVTLKFDFQFDGNKPAAVLIMHKPRYSSLPHDECIIRLLKSMPGVLKGKYIVTEVISCAAYMMHLSDRKAEKFSVTLKADGPVTPTINAGGAASFAWSSESAYGLPVKDATRPQHILPLYRLKQPRPKFWEWPFGHRGDEKAYDAIDRWEDVDPTWNPLDDEGEEHELYDAEMHGDFGVSIMAILMTMTMTTEL